MSRVATHTRPPLFGLAPGGVYPATSVTRRAVRSYRSLSPLPCRAFARPKAVCFLWHFPWGRPRRPLAATVFPWSPDFPPAMDYLRSSPPVAVQPTGRTEIGGGGHEGQDRRCCAGPSNHPSAAAMWREWPTVDDCARCWSAYVGRAFACLELEHFALMAFSVGLLQPPGCFGAHQLIGATRRGL